MHVEAYDWDKLCEARRRVNEVYCYYYGTPNSQMICSRMRTVVKKLDELLALCSEEN